ncbi:MAG: hypothetical protein QOI95_414 [Acidimicrobiaceae bacterium]
MTEGPPAAAEEQTSEWWQTYEIPSTLPLLARIELAWKQRVSRRWRLRFGRKGGVRPAKVKAEDVLERLAALPVSLWTYDFEPGVRHLGPMAQDFAAAFGLGNTNRMIEMTDANGVTMVAVQALYRRVLKLEKEVARLQSALRNGSSE